MRGALAARQDEDDDLFGRIRTFLVANRLSPEPAHYSFAHAVLTDPAGPIAQAVARLTDDGVRLSGRDIERLGGQAVARSTAESDEDDPAGEAARLVAETQAQVDGFTDMVRAMHEETTGFGRDLHAMAEEPAIAAIDEIARLTGAMLGRVRDAETRLAHATSEADALRAKLAEANDTARTDALTGLPNRRAFDEAVARRDVAGGPFCLAVCDVDRFKLINDLHGHSVGDRVLAAIARTLAEQCDGQLVTRYGGEEFAIFLEGTDLAAAAAQLDTVRAAVAGKRFRLRESDAPLGQITVSIGVTALHADESAGSAYDRADRLLYTAKADGRDRVCAA